MKLRRGGNSYESKFSLVSGLKPTKASKLKSRKAILVAKGNYGLWLGDPPQVIPNVRSWEKIKELRSLNPKTKIVRKEDIIIIGSGRYKGTWRIKSIKDAKDSILFDLISVDSINLLDGKINVRVKSLLGSKLQIAERSLI